MFAKKNIHEQFPIFNKVLTNVFSRFTTNEIVNLKDKDPPWRNEFMESKIKWKNEIYKTYTENCCNDNNYFGFQDANRVITEIINTKQSKNQFPKTFYNIKNIPLILPLPVHNYVISDFKAEATLWTFFASQCTPLENGSIIPCSRGCVTDTKFDSVKCNGDDIVKVIRNLSTNEAHGYDNTTIRMIKLFDSAIEKSLSMIYKNCINFGKFRVVWKKSNKCPIHTKNHKQNN